jgi:2-dehydropantoate 2-reductase
MGTSGYCYLQENERGKEQAAIFNHSCLETKVHPQMTGVQFGKLLMNRNNAINALSGLSLKNELEDPAYRYILAECMREALVCYQLEGISHVALTPLPFGWLPALMSYVPQGLFLLLMPVLVKVDDIMHVLVKVDDNATSSMYEDLKMKRDTEIEYRQGEVCRLAERVGVEAPYNSAVRERIKERQSLREGIVHLEASEIITS